MSGSGLGEARSEKSLFNAQTEYPITFSPTSPGVVREGPELPEMRIDIICCFHEGWRGGFFHDFFRSLLYFCARLTRHPAPQRLDGRARFLWHLDGLVGGFRPTLSFSRKSYFGLPRPSGLFDLHPLNVRFFRLGGPSNIFQ